MIKIRKHNLSGFKNFEHCFRLNQIDKRHDHFSLTRTTTDGVCITSLTVDGKIVLVNGMQNFWIDGDHNNCLDDFTGTTQVIFQDGVGMFQIDLKLTITHWSIDQVGIELKH